MKLTYDPRYNVAYIHFREKCSEMDTIRIGDEMNIDIAPDGRICGIELLNANEQLKHGDLGSLLVVNQSTGDQTEVRLSAA